MRKSVIFIIITTIVNIVVAILVESIVATITVHAQNATTIQQTNYRNTTTISPIKRLNASIIIDAINAKIRSVYDGKESPIISNIRH
jgi:preprotein translocase subunit SecY